MKQKCKHEWIFPSWAFVKYCPKCTTIKGNYPKEPKFTIIGEDKIEWGKKNLDPIISK